MFHKYFFMIFVALLIERTLYLSGFHTVESHG